MKIAIIGGGPAGFMAAITAKEQNPNLDITIFDKAKPLSTLFVTGGGRCNLAYAEFDFRELASYFPRGEKFLYSVFNRFDTSSTFDFFDKYNLELMIQEDNRVFPKSGKSSDVITTLLFNARKLGINIRPFFEIKSIEKQDDFIINLDMHFDKVVIATGGRFKQQNNGFNFAKKLGHNITPLTPSLSGFKTYPNFEKISGLTLKNVMAKVEGFESCNDLLFTHQGLSGPIMFEISSRLAFSEKPMSLELNFTHKDFEKMDKELIDLFNESPNKNISNIVSSFIATSLSEELLKKSKIPLDKKANQINAKERKAISKFLTSMEFSIVENEKNAMVTAGGVCLDEINNKTLESKIVEGLYFCGEVMDIDGLTGGFNLQACWSTGYIVGTKL